MIQALASWLTPLVCGSKRWFKLKFFRGASWIQKCVLCVACARFINMYFILSPNVKSTRPEHKLVGSNQCMPLDLTLAHAHSHAHIWHSPDCHTPCVLPVPTAAHYKVIFAFVAPHVRKWIDGGLWLDFYSHIDVELLY